MHGALDRRGKTDGRRPAVTALLVLLSVWLVLGCTPAPARPAAPAAGAAAQTSAPAPTQAMPLQTVRWGYQGKQIVQMPLVVAERTGLLAQEGFEPEAIQMNSPTVTTAALVAGEIDYAEGFSSAVRDAMHGFPIKAIAAGERYSSYQLLSRPEVRTAADLRGGKAGVSRVNSGDYYILVDWIRRQGLNPETDVTVLNIGGTDLRYTSLMSGAIDAGLLGAPASLLAIKSGLRVLADADALASFPLGGLGTTDQKITTKRAEVKKILRAYLRALQLMQQDEETTVALIRDYLSVDDEIARGAYQFVRDTMSPDGIPPEAGVRLIIDIERSAIGMAEPVPFSAVMDLSVLEEARQELAAAGSGSR